MNSIVFQTLFFVFFASTWIIGCLSLCLRDPSEDFRHIICINSIIWTAWLFIATELLSLIHCLSFMSILLIWSVYITANIVYCLRRRTHITELSGNMRTGIHNILILLKNDFGLTLLVIIILVIAIRSSVLALMTAPNNWDSMTYHLSRIMFWIENHSVAYYDTNIKRQLISPPLAEYINLHVISLTGGDIYVNMLQNFASYGCMIFVYTILRRFDCPRKWALTGVILMLTMNVYYAESTSTQVDLVGSFFLILSVYILMNIMECENISVRLSLNVFLQLGAVLGLLYLIKSNAEITAAVVIIFAFIYRLYRRDRIKDLFILFLISGITALSFALPSFIRNYNYCGDILAADYIGGISTGTLAPGYIFLNILKNCGIVMVGRTNAPFITHILTRISEIIGVDLNAPEIGSWFSTEYSLNMDHASASLIIPLSVAAASAGIIHTGKNRSYKNSLALILILQFYISAAAIRWQPWGVRLMLPALVIMIIPIIYFISLLFRPKNTVSETDGYISLTGSCVIAVIILLCISGNTDSYNYMKDQTRFDVYSMKYDRSRFERYFSFSAAEEYYMDLCDLIDRNGYRNIGIHSGEDAYQYPLLARYYRQKNIQNINLGNDNEKKCNPSFEPDVIFAIETDADYDSVNYCNGHSYSCIYHKDGYSVWEMVSSK